MNSMESNSDREDLLEEYSDIEEDTDTIFDWQKIIERSEQETNVLVVHSATHTQATSPVYNLLAHLTEEICLMKHFEKELSAQLGLQTVVVFYSIEIAVIAKAHLQQILQDHKLHFGQVSKFVTFRTLMS
jgi:hypothetical protein